MKQRLTGVIREIFLMVVMRSFHTQQFVPKNSTKGEDWSAEWQLGRYSQRTYTATVKR